MILIKASGFQTISKQRVWLENKAGKLYATPPTPFHAVVVGPNLPFSAQSDPFDSASAGAQLGSQHSCATGAHESGVAVVAPSMPHGPSEHPSRQVHIKTSSEHVPVVEEGWIQASSHALLQPKLIRAKPLAGCIGTLVPR